MMRVMARPREPWVTRGTVATCWPSQHGQTCRGEAYKQLQYRTILMLVTPPQKKKKKKKKKTWKFIQMSATINGKLDFNGNFHRIIDADWLQCLVAMVVTTESKVTINDKFYAMGPILLI